MLKLTTLEALIAELSDLHAIACTVGTALESAMSTAVDTRDFDRIENIVHAKHKIQKEVYETVNLRLSNSSSYKKRDYKIALNRICVEKGVEAPLTIEDDTDGGYW